MRITKKQKEVFDFIRTYTHTQGFSPTQKEIKEHFQLKSFGSVQRYLKYLTDAGYIESDWNARRGITCSSNKIESSFSSPQKTNSDIDFFRDIPFLGKIAAGAPLEEMSHPDESISVPNHMIKEHLKYFALKVKGESMIDDGILDGDIVVCEHTNSAREGQTVAAVIEGEATLKKFHKKGNLYELRPSNQSMSPIIVDQNSGDFQIMGVLTALLRSYI